MKFLVKIAAGLVIAVLATNNAWSQGHQMKGGKTDPYSQSCQVAFNGDGGITGPGPRCVDSLNQNDPSIGCRFDHIRLSPNEAVQRRTLIAPSPEFPLLICRPMDSQMSVRVSFSGAAAPHDVEPLGWNECILRNDVTGLSVELEVQNGSFGNLARFFYCPNPSEKQITAVTSFLKGGRPPIRLSSTAKTVEDASSGSAIFNSSTDSSDARQWPDRQCRRGGNGLADNCSHPYYAGRSK